jgi:phosphoribosylformylglycinamidine synthase
MQKTMPDLAFELNIKQSEYEYIVAKLNREPNDLELYLFSAMYSEHCGYKHSKLLLQNLYRDGGVFCSENAGGIEIGDYTVVFKIESHNHPSAVEPFNGAATGIGGIIRDILAMNARPIALMNSLKFGNLDNPNDKRLLDGVVSGISSYGNCIGVPTIGGEVEFSDCYTSQPLVNVMAVGFAKSDSIKTSRAKAGLKLLLLGSETGVDGLGGAAFASKELDDDEQNRLSVQIADPFMKKRLIEATLEIFKIDGVEACQDCGAAGILSSTSEMGYKSHSGVDLYLDKVHAIKGIKPHEIMLSETQERMVFALKDDAIDEVMSIASKYDLKASIIGETTLSGDYNLYWNDELLASVPCIVIAEPPLYDLKALQDKHIVDYAKVEFNKHNVIELIKSPNFASKKYIFEQYDYTVQGRCVIAPDMGQSAALWLKEADCVLGFSMDSRPFEVCKNPYLGTFDTVVESYKNLLASGFEPKGISNCLNFGNPEKPEVANSFVKSLQGMNDALKSLGVPVVSGNVSFYNEYGDGKIFPTPTIAMMGLAKDYKDLKKGCFDVSETVALVGNLDKDTDISEILSLKESLKQKEIICCLNLSRGGVFGALFRGLWRSGCGFEGDFAELDAFCNYPNCFLVSVKKTSALAQVPHKIIGKVKKTDKITINNINFDKNELFELYENAISQVMEA